MHDETTREQDGTNGERPGSPMRTFIRAVGSLSRQKRDALARLRESEERYRTVIESVQEIIFHTTVQGLWLYLNPSWADITGYSVEETIGQPLVRFVHRDDCETLVARFHQLTSRQEETARFQMRVMTRDGREVWLDGFARALLDARGRVQGVTGTLRDVTEQRRAHEELQYRDELLQAVAAAGNVLLNEADLATALSEAVRLIGMATRADRAYLFENHRDALTGAPLMSQRYEWCAGRVSAEINNPQCQDQPWALWDDWHAQLSVGKNVSGVVRSFGEYAQGVLRAQGVQSLLLVPVILRQGTSGVPEFWGFIGFDDCLRGRAWSDAESSIIGALASSIGGAIMRQRAAAELRGAKESAEAASSAKSIFLANMSHEIRTPLNGIIGINQLLIESGLSDAQRKYAELAKTSADTLLAIINDILDFSKIEAGKLEVDAINVDLHETLRQTIAMLAMRADAKALALTLRIDPDVPAYVHVDPVRLRQVVMNLVNNAVKFTERGGVTVRVGVEHRGPAPRCVLRFAVTDTGIGISHDRLGKLFQPFSQVDASTTRKYGGTGLGLAICRQLVQMMGGTIGVQSLEGQGTTFHFTLVVEERERPVEAGDAGPRHAKRPRRSRILLAEDNAVNQLLARELLVRAGHEVHVVDNGRAALEAFRQGGFDLVLMDVQMPVMDGYEAARAIRAQESKYRAAMQLRRPIAIVALTANAIKGDRERCLDAGMNDYLSKPIVPELLVEMLARYLPEATHVEERAATSPAPAATGAGGDPATLNRSELVARCMGSEVVAEKMLALFVRQAEGYAKELDALAAAQDAAGLASLAHSVKGAAANIGAATLKKAAYTLEQRARAADLKTVHDDVSAVKSALRSVLEAVDHG